MSLGALLLPATRSSSKARRLRSQHEEFLLKHSAIEVLREMDDYISHFLAKRLGQGYATAEWSCIHTGCLRLTVTYRGRVWNIRVPVQS